MSVENDIDIRTQKINTTQEETSSPVDFAVYSGYIDSRASQFLEWCSQDRPEPRDCILVLATLGGDANVAYRIGRALQRHYNNIHIVIPWLCKSAGTLACLCATMLIFGENGELGPLDAQLPEKDELFDFASGLAPLHALSVLKRQSFSYFESAFLSLIQNSSGQLSTTKAARIAIKLTVGLFGGVYAQIDPVQLGKTTRNLSIAQFYGERLNSVHSNLYPNALDTLLSDYPEHGFVIDYLEAVNLFKRVSCANSHMKTAIERHMPNIQNGIISDIPYFYFDDTNSNKNKQESCDNDVK